MGCSQSTQVVEQKRTVPIQAIRKVEQQQKELQKSIIRQIPQRGQCFLIGSLSQKQQIFAHVKLQSMSINKMSVPSGGFTCNNFSSILQIKKGLYFITGGINHDLTIISDESYLYYSQQHKVDKLQSMQQARYTHVSICMENFVYVVGGRYYGNDSEAILQKCEKYSLHQKKWVNLPELNTPRCTCLVFTWHQCIYVLGGYTGPFQRSTKIEYLDRNQKEWKVLDVQLNRGLQGAILLPTNHNQITIFGGLTNSGPTDSVFTVNLRQKTVRSKRKLSSKRSLYKSFYKNGKLHIFGGDDDFTSQIYDIPNQSSEKIIKQFPFSLEIFDNLGFSTATVNVQYKEEQAKISDRNQQDQIVYIFGTTEEPFLCELNISIPYATFHSVPLSLRLYAYQGGVITHNQNQDIILFGGIEDDSLSVITAETYIYRLKTNSAYKLAKMNQNRYAFAYNKTKNHQKQIEFIFCFGGATSNTEGKLVFLSACQKFSLKDNKWQLISPLPQRLISSMSLTYKENIFVFGGTNQKNQKVKDIFCYHQKQDLWCIIESKLLFGLQASALTKISENEFYLFGGRVQNGQSSGVWSLYFNEKAENKKKQTFCVFQQKGQMNEKKSLHKIYKPKHQQFYVVFGGQKQPLTFYGQNLEEQLSDNLLGIKDIFKGTLSLLNHKDLKGYLILGQDEQ